MCVICGVEVATPSTFALISLSITGAFTVLNAWVWGAYFKINAKRGFGNEYGEDFNFVRKHQKTALIKAPFSESNQFTSTT